MEAKEVGGKGDKTDQCGRCAAFTIDYVFTPTLSILSLYIFLLLR